MHQNLSRSLGLFYAGSVVYTTVRLSANGIDPRGAFFVAMFIAPIGVARDAINALYSMYIKS